MTVSSLYQSSDLDWDDGEFFYQDINLDRNASDFRKSLFPEWFTSWKWRWDFFSSLFTSAFADEPEAEVGEEKRKSFFSLASMKTKIADLVCTKEDIWKQVTIVHGIHNKNLYLDVI